MTPLALSKYEKRNAYGDEYVRVDKYKKWKKSHVTKGLYLSFAALKDIPEGYAHKVLSVERLLAGTSPQGAVVHTPSAGSVASQPTQSTCEEFPCTYCQGRMSYPEQGGGPFNCNHCGKAFTIVRCPDCREMRGIQTDHGMKCWRCGHEVPAGRDQR